MLRPEDFTAEWFTAALGVEVDEASIEEIIWGTGTKVRMRLVYADALDLPSALCVKGGFDERLAGFGVESSYVTEAHFFERIAPQLDAPIPRCFYAREGVVVMEDLVAAGASFGDPLEPWDADRVATALEAQAAWHRPTWGAENGPVAALSVGSEPVREAAGVLLGAEHWDRTFEVGDAPILPVGLEDRDRILAGFRKLWERDAAGPVALAHGDAHIGNTYVAADGRPGFLDWQATCRAPVMYDVAYLIGGAMRIEDRRSAERDLLRHYLEALGAGDGPTLDPEQAWEDYRRYTLHGFLWVVTPPVMQPLEKVRAMGERHATAIADHDSLEALGV